MKKPILWILGGAAALYFLARYSFSQKANFVLQSIKPGGSLLSPRILITFAVQNPTNQRITVKSVVGSIYVDDKFLANVSSYGDQTIQPNAESLFTITARPSVVGVFQSFKELFTQPLGNIEIRFSGSANVDGINLPIEQTQKL